MSRSILLKLRLTPSPLWIIFEVNFLRHLAAASLTSIFTLYIRQFVGSNAAVGGILFVGYLAACISSIYSGHIIEHFKKRKALLIALMSLTFVFAAFAYAERASSVFVLFAVYQFVISLFVLDVGLYVKHYSDYKVIAENAGKLGSLGNIGWLVGPLLGSLIANSFGFEAVFLFAAAVSLIALFITFFVRLSNEDGHVPHTRSFKSNVSVFIKNPRLRRTYLNNAGLGFIYSLWDYLPLLMTGIGATIPVIGMTKTLMGVSQAIFEYPIGQMADREIGERKLFIIGYIFATVFTIMLGFTTNLHYFITFFFIAATGTAFLEMTRDSYFFRQISKEEIELVSVYRTSDTLPFLIGQGLAVIFLTFFQIQWWFVIGGPLALYFTYNAYRLAELKK